MKRYNKEGYNNRWQEELEGFEQKTPRKDRNGIFASVQEEEIKFGRQLGEIGAEALVAHRFTAQQLSSLDRRGDDAGFCPMGGLPVHEGDCSELMQAARLIATAINRNTMELQSIKAALRERNRDDA